MASVQQTVRVDAHPIRLSNLDKTLYPDGTTKGEVLGYYSAIAATMLPHCEDRAATRKRWPDGVGAEGKHPSFFQKDIGDDAPDWLRRGVIRHRDHDNEYPLVNDEATLVWLAQLASLEIHVPQWRFEIPRAQAELAQTRLPPDRLVLDLDPGPGVDLRQCARVAFLARDILTDMGLDAIPVTSGSAGIHLYAALDGSQTSDQVSAVARALARELETDHPNDITSSMKRGLRAGKVFIDWSQNNSSKTTIAPYSLRGRARPTVAAPRTWRELASPHLRHLDFREVLDRVSRRGDPLEALSRAAAAQRTTERLSTYRSMRDAARTPEPVPEPHSASHRAPAGDSPAPVFVIQRHEARRLHFDFRLEHDGVLVSWALPKGVPTDPKRNHLAVPTEDHPMEYRHFSGTIPRGEYGAGEVEIWDAGTCTYEKWREDEVIATLSGAPDGPLGGTRTFVLFRTQVDPPQWMIHLKAARSQESAPRPLPAPRPMLATRSRASSLAKLTAEEWSFEMKWDGMRVIASIDASRVTLTSRSGRDVTASFPEICEALTLLDIDGAVLDGEVVALDRRGAPSFARLQERMGLSDTRDVARSRQSTPVQWYAFDLLEVNGTACASLPYDQRRELLVDVVGGVSEVHAEIAVTAPPAFDGDAAAALTASRELGLEGVVAKRRSSPYRAGVRSRDWLKVPLFDTVEVVVIGWRDSDSDSAGFASLLVAIKGVSDAGPGGLRYAGRIASGFTSDGRRRTRADLAAHERATPPVEVPRDAHREAHWVTPQLVGEVSYRELTPEGRLRHAVWRGWRPDRDIAEFTAP